jgi:hypothetical protein
LGAKIAWRRECAELLLGGEDGWVLAALAHNADTDQWRYVLNRVAPMGQWRETYDEARRECEAEVRHLLRECGVDVED